MQQQPLPHLHLLLGGAVAVADDSQHAAQLLPKAALVSAACLLLVRACGTSKAGSMIKDKQG
jgi:hypothetical protein